MVKNLPSNAGDQGSISTQGKNIPHAGTQLLSSQASTQKCMCLGEDPVQPKKNGKELDLHLAIPQMIKHKVTTRKGEKQRRKGKIYPFECRAPKNSKER